MPLEVNPTFATLLWVLSKARRSGLTVSILYTLSLSGNVGKNPVSVSKEYVNFLSVAFWGKLIGDSLPNATVGAGGGVGETFSLIKSPNLINKKIAKVTPKKMPTHLDSTFISREILLRVNTY